jgi:hypothetical protein
MTSTRRIAFASMLVSAAFLVAAPAAAQAAVATGADFGQHVRVCAQTMGLSGTHNPGMHQGYAGWDGMTCDMHG